MPPCSLHALVAAAACLALAAHAVPARADERPAPAGADASPSPRVQFRVFGNTDWESQREGASNTFALGQVDLFATAQIAPNVSALTEVVLEASAAETQEGSPGRGSAEVERFQLRWAPSDAFAVAAGRMHTVLGFWNQTYHHGLWLQTTIRRPEVYRWEDEDGGLLPVHEVGLRVSGSASTAPLRVEYSASVANGRAPRATDVSLRDANGSKAVSAWLALKPRAVPPLQFGGTAVFDRVPPDARAGRTVELVERILGGFAAYQGLRLELLAELFSVRHEDDSEARRFTSTGLYAQGALALGRFKPYYRYDLVRRAEQDPYLEATHDVEQHTVGVRFDPWRQVALKAELVRGEAQAGSRFHAAAVQAAFTF